MRYDGGKNGEGTWQWLVNQMPPHDCYVELFGGSAAVLRRKRPAARSVVVEIDPDALAALGMEDLPPATELVQGDALEWLRAWNAERGKRKTEGRTLFYVDPPYLLSSRRSGNKMYRHELSYADHWRLLRMLLELTPETALVMVSGYHSTLYASMLGAWRSASLRVMTRQGAAVEWLWMNYAEPAELHDWRFLGDDWRHRQKLRRQQRRWVGRLRRMDPMQRQALLAAIEEVGSAQWSVASDGASHTGNGQAAGGNGRG
jgi:16S rRNA G966 N2-methylase RsmD